MGCAVKEQGETSVLHDSIIQERGGAACSPRLDGAHPRLAQPTFLLSFLRARLCWSRPRPTGLFCIFSPHSEGEYGRNVNPEHK